MHSSLRFTFAAAVICGLSLFAAACSTRDPVFTGVDAQMPPGTGSLTVARSGTSTGTVSSSPGGITCGTTCSAAFQLGTVVALTATPDAGAQFAGWSGGCTGMAPTCMVTVDAATAVTATFDVAEYPVTIDLGGSGTGMVGAPLAGISCPGTCTAMIPHGSQISLVASSGMSSQFMGWTVGAGGTACSGTGACSTTITGPTTIIATFARHQSLEVVRSGNGHGTVTSSPVGIDCGTDCSETYPPGTTVTLTANAAGDSSFMGWSGGGCSGTGPCSVNVNGATMVTADFKLRQYNLTVSKTGAGAGTVSSTPAGINCGATCTAAYDAGTPVTLTASPAANSVFAGWSGGGCTGTGSCTVTLAAATTVTATFNPILHTLTVSRSGSGAGTVTSSPAGISCGADCTEDYAQGAAVTLTATPNSTSTFTGWSGGCSGTGSCTVAMSAAVTVTASFAPLHYTLTITRTGNGAGSVSSSPAGISCGTDCTEAYIAGTGVTLTATPSIGSTFTGWSGGSCTGTGTCMVTMNAAATVIATFTLNKYALTVTKGGTGTGSVTSSPAGINCGATCSATVDHGGTVTLTATPAAGSTFGGWSGGGCSGTGTCTVTMTAATSVTAEFTLNKYALTANKSGTGSGTVTSTPAGINCGATCSATFDHGATVTLTATPAVGSTFAGWSGGGCGGTGSTCTVTVTAATAVTATFTLNTYALTVTKGGNGDGTVTSSPAGISCGTNATDCSEVYAHGTTITLTAAAPPGSGFTGWSGGGCSGIGPCTLTLTADTTVTANFVAFYTLTVSMSGSGAGLGYVSSSPAGIDCPDDCSESYISGTMVTLYPSGELEAQFTGWGGACTGTGSCTVTMTSARSVTASFSFNPCLATGSLLPQPPPCP
jgi:hypothetical protein